MIEPGRYGVVATGGWIARLIRWATHSWANHSFIVIEDGKVVEARPEGVRIKDLSEYNGCRMTFNTDEPMTSLQRSKVVDFAKTLTNDEYNYLDFGAVGLQAVGITWQWLFKLAGADHDAMICSQLVAACGRAAGLDWNCGKESPVFVTPGDLAKRIDELPAIDRTLPRIFT